MLSQGKGSRRSVAIVLALHCCELAEYLTAAELRRLPAVPSLGGEEEEERRRWRNISLTAPASNGPLTEKWRLPHSCDQLHLIYRMGGCMRVLRVLQK